MVLLLKINSYKKMKKHVVYKKNGKKSKKKNRKKNFRKKWSKKLLGRSEERIVRCSVGRSGAESV